jgi:hypothetical protein
VLCIVMCSLQLVVVLARMYSKIVNLYEAFAQARRSFRLISEC